MQFIVLHCLLGIVGLLDSGTTNAEHATNCTVFP